MGAGTFHTLVLFSFAHLLLLLCLVTAAAGGA
jgi:hypothetical protein